VFPAAILQAPFFDPYADDAVNYGAIGAVIGHEVGHGFDDQGRKTDGRGLLRDWWSEADAAAFEAKAAALGAQYGSYEALPGHTLNAELTMGENIGDLGGLEMAYTAYKLSLNGQEAPVIDGLTGDQRFFIGWAQKRRGNYRQQELIRIIASNEHSPPAIRAMVPLMNLDAFYQAFDIKPNDRMYLAPDQRVRIW
jgi:predicted metalloendopeptidase